MPTARGIDPAAFAAMAAAKGLTGGPAEPWLTVSLTVPVVVRGTLNSREHWAARHRRVKGERATVRRWLDLFERTAPLVLRRRVRITLTRLGGGKLDSDNLVSAFKGARDEIAAWLGLDDADPGFQWVYAQEPGRRAGAVRITFDVGGA